MMVRRSEDMTPCGAMFDVLKRAGGISHKELAMLVLSERPLADGRSPLSRASDRTWVSRFIVHAPVSLVHQRYFRDYDLAAHRILDRLHSPCSGNMSCVEILDMICGEPGLEMVHALEACGQDARLYRNALLRLRSGEAYTEGERASATLVLFVAVGCSADVGGSVEYMMDYARTMLGGRRCTPPAHAGAQGLREREVERPRALGAVRILDGCVASNPYWIDPTSEGVEFGALVTGDADVADVEGDVSARHARIWHEDGGSGDGGRWLLRDLRSTYGTFVVRGEDGAELALEPGAAVEVHPGDELRLASSTTFVLVEGTAEMVRRVARMAAGASAHV